MPTYCPRPVWLILFVASGLVPFSVTAAPRIDVISTRGLQLGGTTTLTVNGAELLPAPAVWLGDQPISATVKENSTAEQLELEIALEREAFPGIRPLRIANVAGISNAVVCVVDELPQAAWSESIAAWPLALSGVCEGATQRVTSLEGKQGQRLIVEVEARRIGSGLNPTLRVLDSQGSQIAWARADAGLGGDARLVVKLPQDGRYQIELHDALFQAAAPAFFRLKIANQAVQSPPFFRAMNVAEIHARGMESLFGPPRAAGSWSPLRTLTPSAAPTGLLRAFVSPWREVVEDEDALLSGALNVPVGINGQLAAADEVDRYTISAPAGTKLRIECVAERAHSLLDGVLEVQDVAGAPLAVADDQAGTVDPGLEFTMPAETVVLALRDLRHRGGENFRYRLAVAPVDAPDVKLSVEMDRYLVPQSGTTLMRVHADRQGYAGAIALRFEGLPAGITTENAEIPAGANDALVTFRAGGEPAAAVVRVIGAWGDAAAEQTRAASAPSSSVAAFSPWLAQEVAIATSPVAPLNVAWETPPVSDALLLASQANLGMRVARAEGLTGPVRLTLVTTQPPQTRQENNQTVPDLERTLRLSSDVTLAADVGEAPIYLTVPADLSKIPYDLALKAELLSSDGAQVVATALSPSLRLPTKEPSFALSLSASAALTPAAEDRMTFQLQGAIQRPVGFTRSATVLLAGLPESLGTPTVVIPEGQSAFQLNVSLPAGVSLSELRGAKLVASSQLAEGIVISAANEVGLAIQIGPPPAQ